MLFLSVFTNPAEENCTNALRQLLHALKVKVSTTSIRKIKDHPDYPSLFSIADMLAKWKIERVGLKVTADKLPGLPTPFIAHVKQANGEKNFVVVKHLDQHTAIISHGNNAGWQATNINAFLQKVTGTVLLAAATEDSGEQNYQARRRKTLQQRILSIAALSCLLILCSYSILQGYYITGQTIWLAGLLLFLKLTGCYISVLLIWYELDRHNPSLRQQCNRTARLNCDAVLQSAAAKFLGFSWTEIGFAYFAGGWLCLVAGGINYSTLIFLAMLNLAAIPYTLFSVYYQWRVARNWCLLCLTVQGILILELFTALIGGWHRITQLSFAEGTPLLLAFYFVLPFISWLLIKPLFLAARENRLHKKAFLKLKYNHQVFSSLLQQQRSIELPSSDLGILIGPANAGTRIVTVCNPYCNPCGTAHQVLDEILKENRDIQVQIIFTSGNDDQRTATTKHILAIAAKNDPVLTKAALNDWFLNSEKDLTAFSARYPADAGAGTQWQKVEAMSEWCRKTNISFTPTIFLNGRQLPEHYSVSDLKYFLT